MAASDGAARDIRVLPDLDQLALAAAERVTEVVQAAVDERGRCSVALSGGTTPRPVYRLLASPEISTRIDWPRLHLFWGDERCVPPHDPASNYGMALDTMLGRLRVPEPNVHRIHGEDTPEAAATAYEAELRGYFAAASDSGQWPHFDLVLLGLGENGHTASIFPGQRALHEDRRWAMAEYVNELGAWRITLTPPAINAAREVIFLVSGSSKAVTVRRVLEEPAQPDLLPAQAINPAGRLTWLLDTSAASQLSRGG